MHPDKPEVAEAPAPRISFVSLGCPKALVDSERIITRLRAEGYELARGHAGADLAIVNTCGFLDSAQQTIIGQYIEQNVKAFLAIQTKLQEQAKQIYGDKMMLTPDLWKQFMQMQAPAMQGMLGNYLEQSAKLFMDMQQRMQDQTRGMFAAFPFPNFGAAPQTTADEEKKR